MVDAGAGHLRGGEQVLLRVEDLTVEFGAGRGRIVHAVSGVTFDVLEGETLSLVGESGCGKSTTGRAIVQLPPPTRGRVLFGDDDLAQLSKIPLRKVRPQIQMIYQDPISSLNPRRTIARIIDEPLRVWGVGDKASRDLAVDQVLDAVGLDDSAKSRRPHEFSGGQCQRICIARALVLDPRLVICDEPVSALDVRGPGPDLEPARGHEAAIRPHPHIHLSRLGGGQERERPGRCHVSRQALRGRCSRGSVRHARPPLHRSTDGGGAHA